MIGHEPQSMKQTYGFHCDDCGEIWDGYQVPCPIEVSIRTLNANSTCIRCGSRKIMSVMPWRYEEMKRDRSAQEASDARTQR